MDMKNLILLGVAAGFVSPASFGGLRAAAPANFVYENKMELTASGDFDGDGRPDLLIVDRAGGKFRVGFQLEAGNFTWGRAQLSGVANLAAIGVGKILDAKKDSIVFTSADGGNVNVFEIAGPAGPVRKATFAPTCMGPSATAAVNLGGSPGVYIGSIFNVDPAANLATLFSADGDKFTQLAEVPAPGAVTRANRLALKEGGEELLCALLTDKKGDIFAVQTLVGGKPAVVAQATGLPGGADYAAGNFRGQPLRDFVFYKKGEDQLVFKPAEESGGKLQLGAGGSFKLDKPVNQVFSLGKQLLAVFGTNDPAVVYNFDGTKAPASVQTIPAPEDEMVCGAVVLDNGFALLYMPVRTRMKFSAQLQVFKLEGDKYKGGAVIDLPSTDIGDVAGIPDIWQRITDTMKEKSQADMKPYTTTIPGTQVTFDMLPIAGGEYVMGSSDSEKGRNADEAPQHKVKLAPFWMGKYEVTWNEYELFMYPDDEKKLRTMHPTDEKGDKIADAVTRPSKPYVDMSFGMGKESFPAISMTQHGANKYCQWLSAKTGHFYRLPTEAEWEYACRAGTTTAYSFGDDVAQLKDYGWFEKNSDFKTQKVGTKKPNPWGLFDMHGNVSEWCLDQYEENYNKVKADPLIVEPWNHATQPYPHVSRGGSWDDPPDKARSAARKPSSREWKAQDPQLPKSYWYLTDAQFIGFRLVRPLKVPSAQEMEKCWISGCEKD